MFVLQFQRFKIKFLTIQQDSRNGNRHEKGVARQDKISFSQLTLRFLLAANALPADGAQCLDDLTGLVPLLVIPFYSSTFVFRLPCTFHDTPRSAQIAFLTGAQAHYAELKHTRHTRDRVCVLRYRRSPWDRRD